MPPTTVSHLGGTSGEKPPPPYKYTNYATEAKAELLIYANLIRDIEIKGVI